MSATKKKTQTRGVLKWNFAGQSESESDLQNGMNPSTFPMVATFQCLMQSLKTDLTCCILGVPPRSEFLIDKKHCEKVVMWVLQIHKLVEDTAFTHPLQVPSLSSSPGLKPHATTSRLVGEGFHPRDPDLEFALCWHDSTCACLIYLSNINYITVRYISYIYYILNIYFIYIRITNTRYRERERDL